MKKHLTTTLIITKHIFIGLFFLITFSALCCILATCVTSDYNIITLYALGYLIIIGLIYGYIHIYKQQ